MCFIQFWVLAVSEEIIIHSASCNTLAFNFIRIVYIYKIKSYVHGRLSTALYSEFISTKLVRVEAGGLPTVSNGENLLEHLLVISAKVRQSLPGSGFSSLDRVTAPLQKYMIASFVPWNVGQ